MVVDKLENFEKYASLNPLFADVVAFLKATDLNTHELGKMTLKEGELTVTLPKCIRSQKRKSNWKLITILLIFRFPYLE